MFKRATLSQVGGLRVNYNHYGQIVNIHGQINRYNNNCNVCGTLSCTMNHKHKKDHNDYDRDHDRYENHDNNYYYKQTGKDKKYKKNKRYPFELVSKNPETLYCVSGFFFRLTT